MSAPTDDQLEELTRAAIPFLSAIAAELGHHQPSREHLRQRLKRRRRNLIADLIKVQDQRDQLRARLQELRTAADVLADELRDTDTELLALDRRTQP